MQQLENEQIIAVHELNNNRLVCLSSPISGVYKITEFAKRNNETWISSRRFHDLMKASDCYDDLVEEGNIKE